MKTTFPLRMLALATCALASCGATRDDSPAPSASAARAPVMQARATDGRDVDLAASLASGRTVVLVFWQTWCGPCIAEAPALSAAAREHAGELAFVGIVPGPDDTVDGAELERLVKRFELPYPQVRDRDLSWSRAFAIQGTPTLVALRADGSEAWRGHRPPTDWLALHRQARASR